MQGAGPRKYSLYFESPATPQPRSDRPKGAAGFMKCTLTAWPAFLVQPVGQLTALRAALDLVKRRRVLPQVAFAQRSDLSALQPALRGEHQAHAIAHAPRQRQPPDHLAEELVEGGERIAYSDHR